MNHCIFQLQADMIADLHRRMSALEDIRIAWLQQASWYRSSSWLLCLVSSPSGRQHTIDKKRVLVVYSASNPGSNCAKGILVVVRKFGCSCCLMIDSAISLAWQGLQQPTISMLPLIFCIVHHMLTIATVGSYQASTFICQRHYASLIRCLFDRTCTWSRYFCHQMFLRLGCSSACITPQLP